MQTRYLQGPPHISGELAFSPDDHYLVSLDHANNFVAVWHLEKGRLIHEFGKSPALAISMAEKPGDGVFVLTETGITQLKFRQDGCDEIAV
ncbi:MAG TPA: WD40 repeat domain-containing protein, partial [Gemmataceae bacterium]|nr:WD40 repeat domain-containing protein [Gemmataceae bacterium]